MMYVFYALVYKESGDITWDQTDMLKIDAVNLKATGNKTKKERLMV